MRLLRSTILLFGLMAVAANAKNPPCAEWGGVVGSQALYFVESLPESHQAALVDLQGRFGPSWLQAVFKNSQFRFENKTPGVGLPSTIYYVQVDWLSRMGDVVASQAFPEEGICAPLSLFPGQTSAWIDIPRPEHADALRVRMKFWAAGP